MCSFWLLKSVLKIHKSCRKAHRAMNHDIPPSIHKQNYLLKFQNDEQNAFRNLKENSPLCSTLFCWQWQQDACSHGDVGNAGCCVVTNTTPEVTMEKSYLCITNRTYAFFRSVACTVFSFALANLHVGRTLV